MSVLSVVLALGVCLLLPGLGWALKMNYADPGDTLAFAVVLSVCLTAGVGIAMVVTHAWSLGWGLASLGVVSLAGYLPPPRLSSRVRGPSTPSDASAGWLDWYPDVERIGPGSREVPSR